MLRESNSARGARDMRSTMVVLELFGVKPLYY